MKSFFVLLFVIFLTVPPSYAGAAVAAAPPKSAQVDAFNSKNDISVEVQTLAREALTRIRGLDKQIDQLLDRVEQQLQNVQAYLSDETLSATSRSGEQVSIALNYPKYGLILFDRTKWPKVANVDMRRAIAFHEVLSLMELESTGVYLFSNAYLVSTGLSTAELQQALSGQPASQAEWSDGVSCQWILDRSQMLFELWSQGLERCLFNGQVPERGNKILETSLREITALSSRKCHADQKVLSITSKIETLIGTLKASAPASCGQ